MDNLRLILIIAGVVLLAGIYVWGVAVARRRDAPPAADEYRETPEDELESVLDVRAAENVEALGNLENFDIDEDLERDVPAGDPLRQRRPDPADVESEENEISADGTAEIDAGSETAEQQDASAPEDDEIPNLADIDFEPGADDLEGI
ncbi:MAG: hypothetical protein R3174_11140, partial [Gammaproteobacteria bacterium]|nr:hypothetical protein [Gammaproteobacteria bacterium]